MKKYKRLLTYLGISLVLIAVVGISYAVAAKLFEGSPNTINTGKIEFYYKEPTSDVTITQNDTLTDIEGSALPSYFAFTVGSVATGTVNVAYYIYFTPYGSDNTMAMNNIKLYLSKVTNESDVIASEIQTVAPTLLNSFVPFDVANLSYDNTKANYLVYSNYFTYNNDSTPQNHHYRLRMWVDPSGINGSITENDGSHSYTETGGEFKIKINVIGHDGTPKTITVP